MKFIISLKDRKLKENHQLNINQQKRENTET